MFLVVSFLYVNRNPNGRQFTFSKLPPLLIGSEKGEGHIMKFTKRIEEEDKTAVKAAVPRPRSGLHSQGRRTLTWSPRFSVSRQVLTTVTS